MWNLVIARWASISCNFNFFDEKINGCEFKRKFLEEYLSIHWLSQKQINKRFPNSFL